MSRNVRKQNNSMGYQLPYRTLEIVDLSDMKIYALICAYQIIFVPCIVLGYVGFDCMFVNLSIQVIAQFAILSYKVKAVLNSSENYKEGMKELILRHYRLIRLTEELENNFNFPIMQQLMGSSMHICISGYYVLTSIAAQFWPQLCKDHLLAWQIDERADQFPYPLIALF
ncbi:odorant receptor 4-like [Vespula maculifrons]|uniref:Odorant receptor 4-like n=1 Tax=Vespula maculifrons TaxID=7453 RepID=A0ABD2BPM0_VESMC